MPARPRRRLAAALLALALGLVAGSCGGGHERSAEQLLDSAFRKQVRSGDLKLEAQLELRGARQLGRPLKIEASGPFEAKGGRLPSADLELSFGVVGGQTVETGVVSTGERVFVRFEDVYYEVPRSSVARANRAIRRDSGRRSSLGPTGLDPRGWLEVARRSGEADVAGVQTVHLKGRLDVARMLRDLNGFLRRSADSIGRATGRPSPQPLSSEDIARVADVVRNPSFDVYVGKDDGLVRRIAARVELSVPEGDRARLGGLEGGTLRFSLELRDVNQEQRIEAPASARPLSELTRSLGARTLGALGGTGGSTPPATGGPDADAYGRYADCLDRARPEDTDALQRCAELLR